MMEAGLLMGLGAFGLIHAFENQIPAFLRQGIWAAPQAVAGFADAPAAGEGGWAPNSSWERPAAATSVATEPARVIDGDTFDIGGQRVRIADVDTPELRGQCAEEVRLAQAAKARLRVLLAAGPFELHRSGRDEDRYGRKLRVVVRGGQSIGDQLVSEGLARTWTGRREPWC